MLKALFLFAFLVITPEVVFGHGTVMKPVNRASRWKFDPTAPINYDDIELFCGGQTVQHVQNGGKCGLCGDNYADATPRRHELGGKYGEGVIVEKYNPGEVIPVTVWIKANHLGYFIFEMCNLDVFGKESDECFQAVKLKLSNGDDRFELGKLTGDVNLSVKLPNDLKCEHCVFRWTWTTGNTWGQCENGDFGMGCGPQENFRTCSDISIFPKL